MSDIYSPFSSLINTIWTLSDNEYQHFVSRWKDPSSSLSASLGWFHPIHPCFRTCFTLVVLHTNQVMGDEATELLYSSIFRSSSLRQMGNPRVYAFKQSMALFSQEQIPQAYRVQTSTEFIPLQFHSEPTGNETWPVSSTDERGRVIFFVALSDLSCMEQEFARRRKSVDGNSNEFMFLHRCIHVKVGGSLSEQTVTTMNNHVIPCTYFKPLVNHFLVMRSWNDLSPYPDNVAGSEAWTQREKEEWAKLHVFEDWSSLASASSSSSSFASTSASSSSVLNQAVIIDEETLNALMQDEEEDVDENVVHGTLNSETTTHPSAEINHSELRDLLNDILSEDEEVTGTHDVTELSVDIHDNEDFRLSDASNVGEMNTSGHFDRLVAAAVGDEEVEGENEPWNISVIHPVNHQSGFYNLDFSDETGIVGEDEDNDDGDSSGRHEHGVVTPTLAALTALTLSKEHRSELTREKYFLLTTHNESVFPDLKAFENKANLESLLRSFFALQSKFGRNVDSLDAFGDLDLLIRMIQLTPYVTLTYHADDSVFYEKWNFALYLASRSFFHMLFSCGFKDDRYLSCDPDSPAGKQLLLDSTTTYNDFCCRGQSWTCSICNVNVTPKTQTDVQHELPDVSCIVQRQLETSQAIKQEMTGIPTSQCCVCRTSLQAYLPSFETIPRENRCSKEGKEREGDDDEEEEEEEELVHHLEKQESEFRLRTFPYYNTFAFAQLSCRCLKRDYCLACLAELHASANLKSDRSTPYEDSECLCLCLTSTPDDLSHFNVLTRGKHAAVCVLTNMQLRLTYVSFRQLIASSHVASKKYRNVLLWMYHPESDQETYLTELLQGGNQVYSVNDHLCVDIDSVEDRVQEVEFCLCLTSQAVMDAMESGADDVLSSEEGTRLRVICCRYLASSSNASSSSSEPHYVVSACSSMKDSLVRRPMLGATCTDNVLRYATSQIDELFASLSNVAGHASTRAPPCTTSLFMRCTLTGKMICNMHTL